MSDRAIEVVRTSDPNGTTLRAMGECAKKTANTWNFHEWARRVAATAGHRDYEGQLKALYDAVLAKWRYVMEPGEWVANTPRVLIGNVLGMAYQMPAGSDVTKRRIPDRPAKVGTHGFGDCDDVSALMAAAALACGFTPFFRVARAGVSHVSTLVQLPGGRTISADPVGHPTYPFGWALPAPTVEVYDLGGNPTPIQAAKALSGMQSYRIQTPTLFSGVDSDYRPTAQTKIGHWCATPHSDAQGPRVIAIPERFHRLFMSGVVVDGVPGVDDFGNPLRYDAMRDLWIDDRLAKAQQHAMGAGFFKRMGRRWKKRIAGVRKIIQRVAAPIRALQAKLMMSPVAQNIVGAALMTVGIPRAATKAVLQMSGEILKKGGLPGLIRMIKKNPKLAMQMVAQAAKSSLKRAVNVFSGVEQVGQHRISQSGGSCTGHPVMALVGVPYIGDFGEFDVSDAPAPGRWYRIKKGDTLLTVAQRAYGVPTGERLKRAQWINNAKANSPFVDAALKDNLFKNGRISFSAKWASDPESAAKGTRGSSFAVIWIPTTLGDEPSAKPPGGDVTPKDDETDDIPVVVTPADTTKPKPGAWYQVKKGDTLLAVAGAAFGFKGGNERLERARWINDAKANASFVKASLKDSMFPRGRISFSPPLPLIWIPLGKGDEPVKKDEGDLPPEDPIEPIDPNKDPNKDPKDPTRPTDEDEKIKKFKAACERTPNGHYVVTSSGPGCMVCHPEKGEQWNPVTQRCEVKTGPQVDPLKQEIAACLNSGGTWNAQTNVCIPKSQVDPLKKKIEACISSGGTWDALSNVCRTKPSGDNRTDAQKCRDAGKYWDGQQCWNTRPQDFDPEADCLAKGGAWDPAAKVCRTVDIKPDDDKKEGSILPLVVMAALAFLGGK